MNPSDDKKQPYPSELSTLDAPPSYSTSSTSTSPLLNTDIDAQINSLVSRTTALLPIAYQPSPNTSMTILGGGGAGGIGGNRNPKMKLVGIDGKRSWNHSLFNGMKERPGELCGACW